MHLIATAPTGSKILLPAQEIVMPTLIIKRPLILKG